MTHMAYPSLVLTLSLKKDGWIFVKFWEVVELEDHKWWTCSQSVVRKLLCRGKLIIFTIQHFNFFYHFNSASFIVAVYVDKFASVAVRAFKWCRILCSLTEVQCDNGHLAFVKRCSSFLPSSERWDWCVAVLATQHPTWWKMNGSSVLMWLVKHCPVLDMIYHGCRLHL